MLDGLTCLYKSSVDLFFYVVGSGQENELLLMSVLDCLFNACSGILRKNVDKKSLCDNMEVDITWHNMFFLQPVTMFQVIMLALDEMIDGGIILESDPAQVISRAALRSDDIPLGEQTVAQVLQSAKEQLRWSLLK